MAHLTVSDPIQGTKLSPGVLTSSRKITVFKIKMAIFHFHVFGAPLWAVNELLHFQKCRFWHNHSFWKKRINQFEENKLLVIFGCFWWIWSFCDLKFIALNFVQNRSIYIGKAKGFWSIWVDLYRKSQRILINIDKFIQENSKGFLPTSVNLYGKSQRILVNIGRFT